MAGKDMAAYFKGNQHRCNMFILGRSGPDRVPGKLFPTREIYFPGINIPNARSPGYHRVQVWSQSSHLPTRRSDFCAFNLDLDLEPTLHARSPGDHCVHVWSKSSHLSHSRCDLRKKFTDRRRTPRDCISSWNELKNNISFTVVSML